MKDPAPEISVERRKVCLIDDEESIREIYTIGLTAEGFDVVSAVDGKAGLVSIGAGRILFSLIFKCPFRTDSMF